MAGKPDFICIGPEKTATTWLFSMLENHPQVWLAPYKELRFLTEGNLVPEHSLRNFLFSPHWHCRELRRIFVRNTAKMFLLQKTSGHGPFETYAWLMHYLFRKHSFAWYESLFRNGQDLLCGDITPNYYHIPVSRIEALHKHNPNTKILLFVRNPIERVWSGTLMNYCDHDGRSYEDLSVSELTTMLDEMFSSWVPYAEVIGNWKRYFPNMHIAFFDQLKEAPDQFFGDIAEFLGIDPTLGGKRAERVVGKGIGKAMPEAIRAHLKKQYEGEIRALAESGVSVYPERWLQAL